MARGAAGLKPKTVAGYGELLRSRVLPTFGDYELQRIDAAAVRRWISEMDAEGLSSSRIRQARQVLNAVMKQAVVDGVLGRNPVEHTRGPADRPRELRFLTANELSALAYACELRMTGSATLIYLLGYVGLRWGEAVSLRRSDIDILRRRLHVRRSATEIAGRLEFGKPKNHRERSLVLPQFLAEDLAKHLVDSDANGLVFTTPTGKPLRGSNFRNTVWNPALEDAGLESLRIHDLRHTAASLAVSAGASIKAIQRMLGHSSARITLDRYAGLYSEDLMELADRLDTTYRESDVTHAWPSRDPEIVDLIRHTAESP